MAGILEAFNNREQATMIWLAAGCVWAVSIRGVRETLLPLTKTLFLSKIGLILGAATLYVSALIWCLWFLRIWEPTIVKETVYWALGTAFVLLLNSPKASSEQGFFRDVLRESLSLVLVYEFLVNAHTFNLAMELIFLPILLVLILSNTVAATEERYRPVKSLTHWLLAITGAVLFSLGVWDVIQDTSGFATVGRLREFALPPLMTIAFLPFIYLVAVYATYESIFDRIDFFLRDDARSRRRAKLALARRCWLSLRKLRRFRGDFAFRLKSLQAEGDLGRLLSEYDP